MYSWCNCVAGNGKGFGIRGREIDEVTKRVHPEESGALCLSDHQTRAGTDGDVFAGYQQSDHREKSWSSHYRRHSHHRDVRKQCRHAESL